MTWEWCVAFKVPFYAKFTFTVCLNNNLRVCPGSELPINEKNPSFTSVACATFREEQENQRNQMEAVFQVIPKEIFFFSPKLFSTFTGHMMRLQVGSGFLWRDAAATTRGPHASHDRPNVERVSLNM